MGSMWLVLEEPNEQGSCVAAVELTEGDFVIGRRLDCRLVLAGRRVSRQHVLVSRTGGMVSVREFPDAVGTLLNGRPAEQGVLAAGDRLTIGSRVLRLEVDSVWGDGDALLGSTARVREPRFVPAVAPSAPGASQWEPLHAFLDTLRESVDPRVLLKRLLLGLVQIFGAERGFVLLQQRPSTKLVPVASHQLDDATSFIEISSTVYNEALESGRTVFILNSFDDQRCAVAQSVVAAPAPRTIICGPLGVEGQTFGVIYLDMPLAPGAADPSRIPLFETVVGLTSRLLAASQTRQHLLAAKGRIEALNTLAWEGQRLVMGDGPASAELRTLLSTAAAQDVTVLITGETGTGKEMAARAVHRMSPRRDGPFVPVNCAALPHDILEAELFGAEKGAFTGATERRMGRLELASSGTLFLDELGELPLDVQVKLLRVLQERVVTRLGGSEPVQVDFRLICATNADLEEAVRVGTFRKDMYYRINVFRLHLRPLRERRDEIPLLVEHFLDEFGRKFARTTKTVSPEALDVLASYPWPGNVRELRNAIERAVLVEPSGVIGPSSLPMRQAGSGLPATRDELERAFAAELPDDYETAREVFERTFLTRIIEKHGGNVTAAAKAAGMPRSTVYRRLGKLGLLQQSEGQDEDQ